MEFAPLLLVVDDDAAAGDADILKVGTNSEAPGRRLVEGGADDVVVLLLLVVAGVAVAGPFPAVGRGGFVTGFLRDDIFIFKSVCGSVVLN